MNGHLDVIDFWSLNVGDTVLRQSSPNGLICTTIDVRGELLSVSDIILKQFTPHPYGCIHQSIRGAFQLVKNQMRLCACSQNHTSITMVHLSKAQLSKQRTHS